MVCLNVSSRWFNVHVYCKIGNAFKLTNGTWPADPAYFKGRFSNGPVWVEDFAENLGVKLNDFAVGGGKWYYFQLLRMYDYHSNIASPSLATSSNILIQGFTGPGSTIPVPSALDQVTQYLSVITSDIHESLFVILIGANDILFNPNISATQPIQNVASIMNELRNKGTSLLPV